MCVCVLLNQLFSISIQLKKQHERKEVTSHKPEKDMRRDETHILTWKDNNLAKDRHTLKQQTLPSSKLEKD